jgi:hypothetical protein
MTVRGRAVLEGIRFAAGVVSRPSDVVTLWKTTTGGKTVGCLPSTPVPELMLAANLFPIPLASPEYLSLLSGHVDAWIVEAGPSPFPDPSATIPRFVFPGVPSQSMEESLDRIEALAEWAVAVTGFPASEGGVWKAIRAYSIRRSLLDALDERCAGETGFLSAEERRDIVHAGIFLPPEAHSRLLSLILDIDLVSSLFPEVGGRADPLIVLARRLI